jgi:hypothetical protein
LTLDGLIEQQAKPTIDAVGSGWTAGRIDTVPELADADLPAGVAKRMPG